MMNKKGFTLVEVLASAIILATITIAIIFSLSFSQDMVQSNSNKDAYASEVQAAADAIMCFVNGGITTASEIQDASRTGGEYMYIDASSGFNTTEDRIQFIIESSGGTSTLYKITVRIYYGFDNDRERVELVSYSHSNW